MKIDGIGNVGGAGEVKKNKGTEAATGFDSALREAMGSKEASPVTTPTPAMMAQGIRHASNVGSSFKQASVAGIEATLGDLDIYKSALEDESIPPARLRGMSDKIAEKKKELMSLMKTVEDPQLRELLSRTAALVADEQSRAYSLT